MAEEKDKKDEEKEGSFLHSFDINKTSVEILLPDHPSEIKDDKANLKFKEFYSFATFRDFDMNIKNLTNSVKSNKAQLNNHQQLLNHA